MLTRLHLVDAAVAAVAAALLVVGVRVVAPSELGCAAQGVLRFGEPTPLKWSMHQPVRAQLAPVWLSLEQPRACWQGALDPVEDAVSGRGHLAAQAAQAADGCR